jgi:hypothetical protein
VEMKARQYLYVPGPRRALLGLLVPLEPNNADTGIGLELTGIASSNGTTRPGASALLERSLESFVVVL